MALYDLDQLTLNSPGHLSSISTDVEVPSSFQQVPNQLPTLPQPVLDIHLPHLHRRRSLSAVTVCAQQDEFDCLKWAHCTCEDHGIAWMPQLHRATESAQMHGGCHRALPMLAAQPVRDVTNAVGVYTPQATDNVWQVEEIAVTCCLEKAENSVRSPALAQPSNKAP